MKRILMIVVIFLCLALLTTPAAAAQERGNNPSGGNTGQPQVTKGASGPAETQAGQVRETVREETRSETHDGAPPGVMIQNRTETRLQDQDGGKTGEQVQNRTGTRAGNQAVMPPGQSVSQIRETIRLERQQMNATVTGQQRNANQNEVRLAVHALLAMENTTGGIGPQVSAIAREFNNSAQSTYQYEGRIRNRDPVSRWLFGGDQGAAAELNGLTVQNGNRIRQIEQLMDSANLDAETRAMFEEQLRTMEQENTRLGQVSVTEQQDRGIFSWLGK